MVIGVTRGCCKYSVFCVFIEHSLSLAAQLYCLCVVIHPPLAATVTDISARIVLFRLLVVSRLAPA